MHEHSWATPFLLVALVVAFASIFGKVQPMVFGETTAQRLPRGPALVPVFTHLAIVLHWASTFRPTSSAGIARRRR